MAATAAPSRQPKHVASIVTATVPHHSHYRRANGSQCGNTTPLKVATVARPGNTGSLIRRGSFLCGLAPRSRLSLVGLGIGAGGKRRRLADREGRAGMIAGVILLQSALRFREHHDDHTGGTAAGIYTSTVNRHGGSGASHAPKS